VDRGQKEVMKFRSFRKITGTEVIVGQAAGEAYKASSVDYK